MDYENSIPNQLNKDFFKKAIENGLKLENVEIKNLKFSMGSSGGENYCSYIYRTLVTYKDGDYENIISLIVKYMPMEGERTPLIEMRTFERECKMYFEILPEINKLLGDFIFGPKCFYAVETPVRTMVFQDLKELGCELEDRLIGLDEEHAIMVLQKIAKFHAATMIIARNKPSIMKAFDKSMFHMHEHTKGKEDFFLGTIRYLQQLLTSWPNYESIIRKLGKVEKTFYRRSFECVARRNDTISVLNHGDLWVNNIMFKKNKRCLFDAFFVDFQASYYGSLGLDLHFFFNGSIQVEVLKSRRYELLRAYYSFLKETLEKLNYSPIPSWNDVKREVQRTEFYAFYTFETELPLMLLDRDVCVGIGYESLSDENVMKKNRETAFKSKRMIDTTKYVLDRFDELGIFD